MDIEHYIAKRIAFSKKSSFTKTIVRLAIGSTALSIIVMILASATLEGFSYEIHKKVFGFWGNIHLTSSNIIRNFELDPIDISLPYYDQLKQIDKVMYEEINDTDGDVIKNETIGGVNHVQPYVIVPGLVESKDAFQAVLFKGVDGSYNWNKMEQYLIQGERVDFDSVSTAVYLSKNIANRLKLSTGQKIILSFIKDRNKIKRRVEIAGIYNTGLEEYDRRFVIGSMSMIQKVLDWEEGQATGIEIFVDEPSDSKVIAGYLYEYVIPMDMYAETIEQKFPNIFEWLKLQDINETVIYQLMIIVALVNMITVILILVLERSKMIGVLKSLGANNGSIKKIFLYNAFYIILWGLLIGNIVGLGAAFLQKTFGIIKLDEASYYLSVAPIKINWLDIFLINIGSVSIILIALLLPLLIISSITPVKSLRFS